MIWLTVKAFLVFDTDMTTFRVCQNQNFNYVGMILLFSNNLLVNLTLVFFLDCMINRDQNLLIDNKAFRIL